MAPDTTAFTTVGIGASAGGLEALESFFGAMPATNRFAFVVVQHLSPDYKSLMAELLSKHTTIPIHQAEDGVEVEAGNIYLIPRKKNMTMFRGKLFLTAQEQGLNLPIDIFLQSLAEDQGERAVAVILSGTGSDGTRGVRAIKESGGIVMVQDEESARFDGMPRSAISTGIVDYVLPPNQMPRELENYVTGAVTLQSDGPRDLGSGSALSKIFLLIKRKTGVDLSFYKESTITRRIERRMGINQIDTLRLYVDYMELNPNEILTLFKEILIGVTRFFRDSEAFELIKSRVIPEIVNQKESSAPIRVWVAGCSTGEEAYGLAILFAEYLQENHLTNEVKIFATDIDKHAIDVASMGIYPESIAADAPLSRLQKYFVKKGESYQIVPSIREMVIFAYHNIFKDPPFRRVDLISCRNLLIYLQPVLQKKVLSNFHFSLNEHGFLFLGTSETVAEFSRYFKSIDPRWKVFRCVGGAARPSMAASPSSESRFRQEIRLPELQRLDQTDRRDRIDHIYGNLVEQFLPPCVLVDENHAVRHVFGEVSPFLKLPPGRLDPSVLKMARRDLSIPLGSALQKSIRDRQEVVIDGIIVRDQSEPFVVRLTVKPVGNDAESSYHAILFQKHEGESADRVVQEHFDLEQSVRNRITDLETELQQSRENLQATIEELETSNEELQATNEELLSSNEELQSTNEELQSVNEELITVNSEYQKKIEELSELNDDMDNLLATTDIGTVFLDTELRIRKFTPAATRHINMIKGDIGRPFTDLAHNLNYPNLGADIRSVLQSLTAQTTEIQNGSGVWLQLKLIPYRTDANRVGGIVITLIEIHDRKSAELALVRQHDLLMSILESNPSGITMVDRNGLIVYANRKAERLLGLQKDALSRMRYDASEFNITDGDGNPVPSAELPFQRILRSREPVRDYCHWIERSDGRRIRLQISGNAILDEDNQVEGAVFNIEESS